MQLLCQLLLYVLRYLGREPPRAPKLVAVPNAALLAVRVCMAAYMKTRRHTVIRLACV